MKAIWMMALALGACGGGGAAGPGPMGTATAAPDDGESYAHRGYRVTARLHEAGGGDDGEASQTLELHFTGGEEKRAALTGGTLTGCESSSVSVAPVAELKDERLVMLNLLCDQGEDVLTRSVVTALIFVGDGRHPPDVLWEGAGSYQNEFDACTTIDVPFFRRNAAGVVEAMRWTETEHDPEGADVECAAVPRKDAVLATVAVPPR